MNQDGTYSTTLMLADGMGWHLRPASLLAKIAHMFDADIFAERGKRRASAKSLSGIVMLCASGGKHLRVTAHGHDARDAIRAIEAGFPMSVQGDGVDCACEPTTEDQGCGEKQHNDKKEKKTKGVQMIIKKVVAKVAGRGKAVATTLSCVAMPEAKKAFLAGDFNGWNPQADAMVRRNGLFTRSIKLAPGEHQYKFIIDGEWYFDPSAPTMASGMGTSNNVVRVNGVNTP